MVTLNDQLAKLDPQVETIVSRFVANLKGLLDDNSDKVKENLFVNESTYFLENNNNNFQSKIV